jgi:hypothetical protein
MDEQLHDKRRKNSFLDLHISISCIENIQNLKYFKNAKIKYHLLPIILKNILENFGALRTKFKNKHSEVQIW